MSIRVEEYINKQNSPQKEIIHALRAVILKTAPGVTEEFKMGVPWYSGKFYIVALRDHVNLGFSVQGLSDAEKNLFRGKGSMMRHLKFYSLKDVDEAEVAKLVGLVAEKSTCC